MSTTMSADVRAVVAAVDRLTTQVKRLADALSTPADAPTTTADDEPAGDPGIPVLDPDAPARVITHLGPVSEQRFEEMRDNARQLTDWITERAQQTTAADDDAQRTTRREQLHNLLARLDSGGLLSPGDHTRLRTLVDAETRDADTMRAVAAGNKRHVKTLIPEIDRLTAELEDAEQRADGFRTERDQAQAAIDRVRALRDPIAEAIEQADYSGNMRRGDLADSVMPVILAALDGTDQPTTKEN